MNRLISRTLSTTKSRLALIEKDAIIHVSWTTPSKKIGIAHSKYGDVLVKEVCETNFVGDGDTKLLR